MNGTGYAVTVTDDESAEPQPENVRATLDQLAKLARLHELVVETEAAYKAAVAERDQLMRRLYGRRKADVRDLVKVTGLYRTVVHGIVKGARDPQPRRGPRS